MSSKTDMKCICW